MAVAGDRIVARGVIVGARDGHPYGVSYKADLGIGWTARRLDLETTDGRSLSLRSDGAGRWSNAEGAPLPALDGCIDIDLAGSPFTNTLPIRRTGLGPEAGTVSFRMAYIPFTTFVPTIDVQNYTCLAAGRLYRYEAADGSFAAELTVDEDGLVVDYPQLFRRVAVG